MNVFGYETKTTFWEDFSIADRFGTVAIEDTFSRAFAEWKYNHIYLTELVLVLNWKLWEHHEKGNDEFSRLYETLYWKADDFAREWLSGDELAYYYETTD